MPIFPYHNFLNSSGDFDEAKKFWQHICDQEISSTTRNAWTPWLTEITARDDRSATIYSLWNSSLNRGFMIEQLIPVHSDVYAGARMDVFGKDHLPNPIEYMFFWCELSEGSEMIARRYIRIWTDPSITLEKMNHIVEAGPRRQQAD